MAFSFDITTVRSTMVQQLHDYWHRLRGARPMPARTEIDPAAIKPLLPFIIMTEVHRDPLRVRFRLVGTAVVEHSRLDFTGMWLHELDFGEDQDWLALYEVLLREKRPLFLRSAIPFEAGQRPPAPYEIGMMPLSADGIEVSGVIAVEDYGLLSLADRARVGKVRMLGDG